MEMISLEIPGREKLSLKLDVSADGVIVSAVLKGVGDRSFLKFLESYRAHLKGPLKQLPLPMGHSPAELLLTEAILRARNEWNPPGVDDEVCHCRSVPRVVIDRAIVAGAHSAAKVSAWTSASTACGTCRPEVEAHLRFRLRTGN
jgi:NAD(P)H-nitrite reductase large subunit